MKTFKKLLRWWIALASFVGFMGGWAMLAHSPKPIQPGNQNAMIATLEPLPPLPPIGSSSNNGSGPQIFSQRPSSSFRFRTGGS